MKAIIYLNSTVNLNILTPKFGEIKSRKNNSEDTPAEAPIRGDLAPKTK